MQRAQPWPCTRNLGVLWLPRPRLLPVVHEAGRLAFGGREEEKKRSCARYPAYGAGISVVPSNSAP